jgi:hypothetical protein
VFPPGFRSSEADSTVLISLYKFSLILCWNMNLILLPWCNQYFHDGNN